MAASDEQSQNNVQTTVIETEYLAEKMTELAANLQNSLNILRKAKDDSSIDIQRSIEVQRIAMFRAVHALVTFVGSFPEFEKRELFEPLVLVESCLLDLTEGIVNPIFRLEQPSNASDWETRKFKYTCAVAMEELMQAGMKRKEASAYVVRVLPDLNLKAKTVEDWRDNLTGHSGDEYARPFRSMLNQIKALAPKTKEQSQARVSHALKSYDISNVNLRNTRSA